MKLGQGICFKCRRLVRIRFKENKGYCRDCGEFVGYLAIKKDRD